MVDLLVKKYGWICEWEDELAKDTPEFIECVKVHAAEDPATEPEVLRKFCEDENSWVRYKVAENPNCPLQVLYALKDDAEVARGLASNPNLPPKMFYYLLEKDFKNDIKDIVKREIVENPNCPVDILDNFASSQDVVIRSRVAGNPHSSAEILEKVFQHSKRGGTLEFLVFEALAFNHHTPPAILEKIAEYSEYKGVITRLIDNQSTPPQVLKELKVRG